MAIKLSGEFTVRKSPDEVFNFLTDPKRFAPLLPEFQSLSVQDERHFTVRVNVGVSYIKGAANLKLELTEAERPRRAQYKGQGAVAGGSVTVIASFDLAARDAEQEAVAPRADSQPDLAIDPSLVPEISPGVAPVPRLYTASNGGETKVCWQGEAQIFGPLASAAGGLLEPLGKKQVQKLIDSLQSALA